MKRFVVSFVLLVCIILLSATSFAGDEYFLIYKQDVHMSSKMVLNFPDNLFFPSTYKLEASWDPSDASVNFRLSGMGFAIFDSGIQKGGSYTRVFDSNKPGNYRLWVEISKPINIKIKIYRKQRK